MSARPASRANAGASPIRRVPGRPDSGSNRDRRLDAPAVDSAVELAASAEPNRNLYAIVQLDIVGSGTVIGHDQRRLRRDLDELAHGAVKRRGFDLDSFPVHDTGDGLRLFIPLNIIQPTDVVDLMVLGLAAGLRQHRRFVSDTARIRLWVAFDLGLIERHLRGWAGDPLVRVARLIEAEPLREALRSDPRLDLVAVVSESMYTSVVQPGEGYIGPDCFREIHVRVKEFDARAWLLAPYVPGLCGVCDRAAA